MSGPESASRPLSESQSNEPADNQLRLLSCSRLRVSSGAKAAPQAQETVWRVERAPTAGASCRLVPQPMVPVACTTAPNFRVREW